MPTIVYIAVPLVGLGSTVLALASCVLAGRADDVIEEAIAAREEDQEAA